MLAKKGSNSLMLRSHKTTVRNSISKYGKETIKNRHAMPVDIEQLLKEQKEYEFTGKRNNSLDAFQVNK